MPFDGLEKIGRIVDSALDAGGSAVREFLCSGDEPLFNGFPVDNSIFGNCNFWLKTQVDKI